MAAKTATILLLAATSVAHADYDPSQYPAYETCALCHGLFGVSHTGKFPNLGGQKQAYIEAQVRAFLDSHRTNDGGQMVSIVTELHPEDIPFVAEWFASQDHPEPYPADEVVDGQEGFADLGCASCHDNGADKNSAVPYLTAQKPAYLAKQMQDFREGRRDAQSEPGLHKDLLALPDDQIDAIAKYLGAIARP